MIAFLLSRLAARRARSTLQPDKAPNAVRESPRNALASPLTDTLSDDDAEPPAVTA